MRIALAGPQIGATHIAPANNALGDEQIQGILPRSLVVSVHVPKTDDEKLSPSIKPKGVPWNRDLRTDGGDPLAFGNYREAKLKLPVAHVDHGHARNSDRSDTIMTPALNRRPRTGRENRDREGNTVSLLGTPM